MPLPGFPAGGRRKRYRPCLFSRAIAPDRRIRSTRSEFGRSDGRAAARIIVRATAATHSRSLAVSNESRITEKLATDCNGYRKHVAGSIRENQCESVAKALPADADRDRAEVGGDVHARAVLKAEFGIDFHVRANFAGDAGSEILAELVQAGMKKIPIDRQA